MSDATLAPSPAPNLSDRQWYILGRWQEVEGEARANLLRIISIGVCYSIELVSQYNLAPAWLQLGPAVSEQAHQAITALAVAWLMLAFGVHLLLGSQVYPPRLGFAVTACDIILLTTLLMSAHGPRSAMVVGYFLVIVLAGLRLRLSLVWLATTGSMLGYLFLLGYAKWFVPEQLRPDMLVPRYQQLLFLTSLALTGIMLGQILRRLRSLAENYASRLAALPGSM